jgi:WD40 repeat protein
MRFRLFKLGRRTRLLLGGLGSLGVLALGAGCSGKAFTAGTASASGSGGTAAGAGGESASEAGDSGSAEGGSGGVPIANGGGAGEVSSAGSAGKPPVSCDCVAGEYCQDGTNKCRKCADYSRLEFGAAQRLSTLTQSPQSSERFARPAIPGSALFYVSGAPDSSKILYTASPVSGVGTALTSAGQVESGPLFVNGFADQNLFFDRQQPGGRKLRMALWTAPAVLTKDALLPEPLNAADSDDYSIAISPNTGHVYWMSTRNGQAELLWQATSTSAPPPPAVLDLNVKAGTAECPRSGDDATPWVNLAGTLLLFRNPSLNEDCTPNDSGATDLFAAPLSKDGTPLAAAVALASLNVTGGMSRETDPSLSSDACAVYFASDSGTGDFDLYKATRN